jgi:hypothetical protein
LFCSERRGTSTDDNEYPSQSSQVVRVDRGEVLAAEGNDLIVRMEECSIQHFENIPESAKATVEGKQLGIHDLKPGMKLQRSITTTTTPRIVTTVATVSGKVWHVTPPLRVILTLENGTNQSFKIPKDQKFKVNRQMVDAFELKKGLVVTATKIVEVPVSVLSQGEFSLVRRSGRTGANYCFGRTKIRSREGPSLGWFEKGGGWNAGFLRFRSNFARAGLWKSPNSVRNFLPLWNK